MQMWWVSRNLPYPPHNQLVFMPSFGIYTEFEEEPLNPKPRLRFGVIRQTEQTL